MKRFFLFALIFAAAGFSIQAAPQKELKIVAEAIPQEKTYVMYIQDYDWGAGISKIVILAKNPVSEEKIEAQDFEIDIYAKIEKMRLFPVKHKQPKVCAAYLCDPYGNPIQKTEGRYIALEFSPSEENKDTHPFNNTMLVDIDAIGNVHIENDNLNIDIKNCAGIVNKKAALFNIASLTKKGETNLTKYAYFLPNNTENKQQQIPLIVWFHAIGEGGTNPYLPLFGQRAVNFATEQIQKHFKDGAAVLVPLCPTGYMELKNTDRFKNRLWAPVNKSTEKSVSYYTDDVADLIDEFVAQNPCIDKNRIYLGGASAGGYMVINMLLEFPQKFAAAFAASQAYPDKNIPNENIAQLASTPLWFIIGDDDQTINPENYTLATYMRLQGKTADLRLSQYQDITTEDGKYNPHYSWIYIFRDEVFDDKLNLFDWLSQNRCDLP